MNSDFVPFVDPTDHTSLAYETSSLASSSNCSYPVINRIPRFVPATNYASSFGAQWNRFPKTQLDSYSGITLSRDRLSRCMRGHLTSLDGKLVLEAGSGAGRFSEVLLKHGAHLHSFDYSCAVEANASNNKRFPNFWLAQADIRNIPFQPGVYDYVVCLGVVQHTPSPEETLMHLWDMVKPGGFLVFDHYKWSLKWMAPPPIRDCVSLYRRIILSLPLDIRFPLIQRITDFWFPLHWRFKDASLMQKLLRRVSPVIFHYPEIKLQSRRDHYNWSLLDTHDSCTDYYKHLRSSSSLRKTMEKLGAIDIEISEDGNGVEVFCRKEI